MRGIGIVEFVVTLAVLAVLVTAAVPSLAAAVDRRRLAVLAGEAAAALQSARGAALARGEPVRVAVAAGPGGSQCLLVHAGPAGSCLCDGPPAAPVATCADPSRLVTAVAVPAARGLSLAYPASGLRVDPFLGTVTPTATLRILGRRGAVHHAVNLMGRVRSCTPAPAPSVAGWPPC